MIHCFIVSLFHCKLCCCFFTTNYHNIGHVLSKAKKVPERMWRGGDVHNVDKLHSFLAPPARTENPQRTQRCALIVVYTAARRAKPHPTYATRQGRPQGNQGGTRSQRRKQRRPGALSKCIYSADPPTFSERPSVQESSCYISTNHLSIIHISPIPVTNKSNK